MFTLAQRHKVGPALAVSVLTLLIAIGGSPASARASAGSPVSAQARGESLAPDAVSGQPWRNPNQPPQARASELLAALTTDQKIQLALGNFAALRELRRARAERRRRP